MPIPVPDEDRGITHQHQALPFLARSMKKTMLVEGGPFVQQF
jgi:hypothetical protein